MSRGNEEYERYTLFEKCIEGKNYNLLTDSYNGPKIYDYAIEYGD